MKYPMRGEIWKQPYAKAYVIGVRYGFVKYIQKTRDIYKPLEMQETSFIKLFQYERDAKLDIEELFKE